MPRIGFLALVHTCERAVDTLNVAPVLLVGFFAGGDGLVQFRLFAALFAQSIAQGAHPRLQGLDAFAKRARFLSQRLETVGLGAQAGQFVESIAAFLQRCLQIATGLDELAQRCAGVVKSLEPDL